MCIYMCAFVYYIRNISQCSLEKQPIGCVCAQENFHDEGPAHVIVEGAGWDTACGPRRADGAEV